MYIKFSNRKFVSFFLVIIIAFITYHLLIWYFLTSKIFNASPYYIGDLGRMSYQIDSLFPRIEQVTLPNRHFNDIDENKRPIDLITIGDSFSNGMGSGTNPYYQDYLATALNINILNIQNLDNSFGYIDTIRYLHKNGWLRKVQTKAVLIECVARETLNHVPSKNNTLKFQQSDLNATLFKTTFTREFPKTLPINTGNYKASYYYMKYKYSIHAKKEVYKFPLVTNLFSSKDKNHLLVYNDDINNIDQITDKSVILLNQELNLLSNELKKDGITLLFMPVVDKYDLYYNFIEKNDDYPRNPFFTLLRKQQKNYIFVDTKAILIPLLEKNISDVYYPDDTHWSFNASAQISKNKTFTFLSNKGI